MEPRVGYSPTLTGSKPFAIRTVFTGKDVPISPGPLGSFVWPDVPDFICPKASTTTPIAARTPANTRSRRPLAPRGSLRAGAVGGLRRSGTALTSPKSWIQSVHYYRIRTDWHLIHRANAFTLVAFDASAVCLFCFARPDRWLPVPPKLARCGERRRTQPPGEDV